MSKQHATKFLDIVNDAKSKIKECTIADVVAKKDANETFWLVDVREESEFAAGRIPGAVHIGKGVIERDIEKIIPNQSDEVILYCGGGYRSALAAENLQRMGYSNVISMDGGMRGWRTEGYDEEK